MTHIHIDFETRSNVDLRKSGVYPYAEHPSTGIWCMAWALGAGPVNVWRPGTAPPAELVAAIRSGAPCYAHNAQFERVVWNAKMAAYGFPVPALEQWYCTAAMAAAMALPRSLGDAASVLGLPAQKDREGAKLMMQMARPRKIESCPECQEAATGCRLCGGTGQRLTWWDDAGRRSRLEAYCVQDVEVERQIAAKVRPLTPDEQAMYWLDQRINDRGVGLDRDLVQAARVVADKAMKRLNRELYEVTGGKVSAATKAKDLTAWLNGQGADTDGVSKAAVRDLLSRDDLAGAVRAAVEIRSEAARSSTAKLKAMHAASCTDGRIRGLLLFHGAGTGRWSGRLVQPQNFPRGSVEDAEDLIPLVLDGEAEIIDMLHAPALDVVSSLLRSCLVAVDGKDLIAADYSNIEGRITAWLAGEAWKVQAFRDFDAGVGPDLYKLAYSRSFGILVDQIDKAQRQIGKVLELSMGFQGGVGAFQAMAVGYGMSVPDEEADRLKTAWRGAHPNTVALWRGLEDAAMDAVRRPGQIVSAASGRVRFRVKGPCLWMVLPSGRALAYPMPSVKPARMPWTVNGPQIGTDPETGEPIFQQIPVYKDAVHYWGVDSRTRKWCEQKAYGGLWTENAVQAIAADVLRAGMRGLEAAGYPIVLTVHDEAVCEVPDTFGSVADMENIMCTLPAWAEGLPVAAAGWRGRRYRK